MRRGIKIAAATGAVVAALIPLLVGHLLTRPHRPPLPASRLPRVVEASFVSQSGARLSAWYSAPVGTPRGSAVLLHPLRADRRAMEDRALVLLAAGYAVLLP